MATIQVMDEELVNHIAAGEVVERPASVLKELLENALDAGATKIMIRVKKGGIDLVEVSDNGSGIGKADLEVIANPHSTSKLIDLTGLEHIDTLGFRGEALASICAVSEVEITSYTGKGTSGNKVAIVNGTRERVVPASRDKGTSVSVRNLFKNVPARRSFLKLPTTEYRKLVETFIPHALVYPNVHFIFETEGKIAYNLPAIPQSSCKSLHPQRLKELFPNVSLIELFYDGEGMLVGGYAGHPKHQSSKVDTRYIFVNGRPIWDNGVARSVLVGAERFIVDGMKIPFFVMMTVPHQYVDVNVHPRKSEVRFANPYRVYSAVENAVKKAFQESLRENEFAKEEAAADRLRPYSSRAGGFGVSDSEGKHIYRVGADLRGADRSFRARHISRREIDENLSFTKRVLDDVNRDEIESEKHMSVLDRAAFSEPMKLETDEYISARQFLNRYIIAEIAENLFIIDQHAAAERIRFEKLQEDYASEGIEKQGLIIPVKIKFSDTEAFFAEEAKELLKTIGYGISVQKDTLTISTVPAILQNGDHASLFRQILGELQDFELGADISEKINEKYRDSLFATMACHSSVRMNQRISDSEAIRLVRDLFKCRNAYSCPHGRPIVWRITSQEIDQKFNR